MATVLQMPRRPSLDRLERIQQLQWRMELSHMAGELALEMVRIVKKDKGWQRRDMDYKEWSKARKVALEALEKYSNT
jgi:hypothetical protein